ncbi:MAG: PhoH family protein [Caulobacteraceae bacterium]|nr:PhoH family protein [Caulobacteraceae bacterium]
MNATVSDVRLPSSQDVTLPFAVIERLFVNESGLREIDAALKPFRVQIQRQGEAVRLTGDELGVSLGAKVIQRMIDVPPTSGEPNAVHDAAQWVVQNALKHDLSLRLTGLPKAFRAMSLGQVAFMETLLHGDHALIFGVGPTGTGKTHLAVAAGLTGVAEARFKCLVITRPRVMLEGEVMTASLRAETAYDEQLTPIEDVLHDLIGHDEIRRMTEHGLIRILPLGALRGRTFNNSFIILDEAQNMTVRKMRMAVTRMGAGSRMVVTGDLRQVDLPEGEVSGLSHLLQLISGTDVAAVHQFQTQQIIRNEIVAQLEALYGHAGGNLAEAA